MAFFKSVVFILWLTSVKSDTATVTPAPTATTTLKTANLTSPEILEAPSETIKTFLNSRVELLCKASGNPQPEINWFYRSDDNEPSQRLERVGADFRVHKNGSLIFRAASKRHEGEYACKAENESGVAASEFVDLVVEAKVKIEEWPDVIYAERGEKLSLECVATGDPAPLVTWLKDNSPVKYLKEL